MNDRYAKIEGKAGKTIDEALTKTGQSGIINNIENAEESALYGRDNQAEGLGIQRHLRYGGDRSGNKDEKLSAYFR